MASSERDVAAVPAPGLSAAAGVRAAFDAALVLEVLEQLVGAHGEQDVAAAALPPLLRVPGVRAAAVVVRERASAVVVGSAGYDCGSMAPGAALPLDAGLPVTEALRRRTVVVQGTGPSWVAVPFSGTRTRTGALLVSLDAPPPRSPAELWRLERIARAVGQGLRRAAADEQASAELALLRAGTTHLIASVPGWDVAVRCLPWDSGVSGDVVVCAPDGRGGHWWMVADVCGSGLAAAVVARTVHATLAALAEHADGPAALLAAAERALRPALPPDSFVTALVVRTVDGRLDVATAGHPPPVLLTAGGARTVPVEPRPPLGVEAVDVPTCRQASFGLDADAVLVLHTDGLLDRRGDDGPCDADLPTLLRGLPADDVQSLADAVLAAAGAVGVAGDDVSLLVARPRRAPSAAPGR